MPFIPKDWSDFPSVDTPIYASDLERIEAGIETAQADIEAHTADSSDAHDASAISVTDAANQYTATNVETALAEVLDALQAHEADSSDAHDASAISLLDTAGDFDATNVEDALAELHGEIVGGGGASSLVDLDDVSGGAPVTGEAPVWDGDSFELTDVATAAELAAGLAVKSNTGHAHAGEDITSGTVADARIASTIARDTEVTAAVGAVTADLAAHIADSSDAHDASAISIADAGNDFTATDVEGALAELQAGHETDAQNLADHIADTTAAHAATAIGSATATGLDATNVQAALVEIQTEVNATTASLADHLTDTDGAHSASEIAVDSTNLVGVGTDVQAVLEELDDAIAAVTGGGGAAITVKEDGSVVDATVDTFDFLGADFDISESPENEVNISISSAIARDAEVTTAVGAVTADLAAHLADSSDAHDASAISVLDAAAAFTATDVEGVLAEIAVGVAGAFDLVYDLTTDHIADATDAHDASAISFTPVGTIAATDVQSAIAEVASEAGGGGDGVGGKLALYTFCR